jgi:hypothetical protein
VQVMTPASKPILYALLLATLTMLFGLRVLGQVIVVLFEPGWLPPFERWYSGLMPYPLLLPTQLIMIAVMIKIVVDFVRGSGFFLRLGAAVGKFLIWSSAVYALGMAARYVITMSLHPELRWFTGTIPIWFHFVLAAFLYILGRYQLVTGRESA